MMTRQRDETVLPLLPFGRRSELAVHKEEEQQSHHQGDWVQGTPKDSSPPDHLQRSKRHSAQCVVNLICTTSLLVLGLIALGSLAALGQDCPSCLGPYGGPQTIALKSSQASNLLMSLASSEPSVISLKRIRNEDAPADSSNRHERQEGPAGQVASAWHAYGREEEGASLFDGFGHPVEKIEQIHLSFGGNASQYVVSFVSWLNHSHQERLPDSHIQFVAMHGVQGSKRISYSQQELLGIVIFCRDPDFQDGRCRTARAAYSEGSVCLPPRVMFDIAIDLPEEWVGEEIHYAVGVRAKPISSFSLRRPIMAGPRKGHYPELFSSVEEGNVEWTGFYSFRSLDPARSKTKFAIFGDLGIESPNNALALLENLTKHSAEGGEMATEFAVHLGDIAYHLYSEGGTWGDMFMRNISTVTKRIPYVFGVGNHEFEGAPVWGGNYRSFECRFLQNSHLGRSSGSNSPFFFSWDVRGIHFVYLHSDVAVYPTVAYHCYAAQNRWLENDLKRVDRRKTPWIVVIGHRGLYCTRDTLFAQECKSQAMLLRWTFESVLLKYKVDLFVSGHTHHYERSWPLLAGGQVASRSYTNPEGVVHVQPGCAGTGETEPFPETRYEWEAFRDENGTLSIGMIEVEGSSILRYRQLRNSDGHVIDSFEIRKTSTTHAQS